MIITNAWLVRPNPQGFERMKEFLKQNIVAIGWPGIGDLTNLSTDEIKLRLCAPPYGYSSLELGNTYAVIDAFVHRMAVGDYVLVPHGHSIYFAKIESDYLFNKSKDNEDDGFPHQRKVTWVSEPIPRSSLPDTLRNALKIHRSTANLTKYFDIIVSLATGDGIPQELAPINEFLKVNYPLRPDMLVTIEVPKNITKTEALRLSEFVKTLYFDNN
ncbi:restriction endonuclease [Pelosinus propionicus]|uniref:Uncharacterized protein n=1 Tax=Pelosinus propionicus DSM 13327 TaxID=1123291 RepID=A0A1I4PFQ6_9FIRM|nr:hypothetical protein [Pelosinus propionicus]SFM26591.1 hypothetical protein SAMN04490355_10636 [Pelosinus propionicus DSM 13327]